MTRLDDAVARVRVEIEAAFPPGEGSYCAIPRGDLRTILAALPTPEERALLETLADECKSVASKTREYFVREVYTARAAILRALLARTGGATDGE